MIINLYTIIVLLATTIGASTGLGGGVIIKPLLDAIGFHNVSDIAFLSTCCVLAMTIYNVGRHVRNKESVDVGIILRVSIGSALGGVIGSRCFEIMVHSLGTDETKKLQSLLLAILLTIVCITMIFRFKRFTIKSKLVIFGVGLVLGFFASFLGIGGGPINVAAFNILFSFDFKKSTLYSLATILCAQVSTLFTIAVTTGFSGYDTTLLLPMIVAAILGGIIGSHINRKATRHQLRFAFNTILVLLIALNIYNCF